MLSRLLFNLNAIPNNLRDQLEARDLTQYALNAASQMIQAVDGHIAHCINALRSRNLELDKIEVITRNLNNARKCYTTFKPKKIPPFSGVDDLKSEPLLCLSSAPFENGDSLDALLLNFNNEAFQTKLRAELAVPRAVENAFELFKINQTPLTPSSTPASPAISVSQVEHKLDIVEPSPKPPAYLSTPTSSLKMHAQFFKIDPNALDEDNSDLENYIAETLRPTATS